MKTKYIIPSIIVLFIIVIVIVTISFNENSSIYGNYGELYINEVSATNFSTITDEDGDYSDYIEIYNNYKFDVNLKGYHLSDKEFDTKKWTFPDIVIKSKEYLLVFASGKDKYDKYIHTNFKLKELGEIVTLTDANNTVISKVKLDHTSFNTSYGYTGRRYVYYYSPTPGVKNKGDISKKPILYSDENITLKVTEYITQNTMIYDREGDYNSMVELHNYGDKDINLKGFFVSDSTMNLGKYPLPDVTIKKKDYLVIYLSDKNKYMNDEIHANFKLKANEVFSITSSHGKLLDQIGIIELPINTSYGLNSDNKWCYYPTSTFGYSNNTQCFEKLGELNE